MLNFAKLLMATEWCVLIYLPRLFVDFNIGLRTLASLLVWTGRALHRLELPYILAYKPTIFGSILTFKLWGSAYTRVMPHSQSLWQSAWRLSVSDAHCVWAAHGVPYTISRSLGLRGCVGESTLAGSEWPPTDLCCCCCIASHCNLTPFQHRDHARRRLDVP